MHNRTTCRSHIRNTVDKYKVSQIFVSSKFIRGFQGQINSGEVTVGDGIMALPSGDHAQVTAIYVTDQKVQTAQEGQPVTIQLDKEIDISPP